MPITMNRRDLARTHPRVPILVPDLTEFRSLTFHPGEEPEMQENAEAVPSAGQVLIQVDTVPVFSEDLRAVHELAIGSRSSDAVSFGRTIAGLVLSSASDVKGLSAGDRVLVPDLAMPSGKDAQGYCGAFSEIVGVSSAAVVPLPEDVTFEEASLIAMAARLLAALDYTGTTVPTSATIIGTDLSGLVLIALLQGRGCTDITVVGSRNDRLILAASLGAEYTLHLRRQPVTASVLPDGLFVIATDCDETISLAAEITKPLFDSARAAERILGDDAAAQVQAAIELTASRSGTLRRLHTHSFKLSEFGEAVDYLRHGRDGINHAVIKPGYDRRPPWGGWS